MKIETLRSIINSELSMLPHKFSDPTEATRQLHDLEEKLGIRLRELFDNRTRLERSKKKLSQSEFKSLLCCYFKDFVGVDGFDYVAMERELTTKRKTLARMVGDGWIHSITIMVRVLKEIDKKEVEKQVQEKPRGLLRVAD